MVVEERPLVTGGTGFLGSRLVRRLLEEGIQVHATHTPARPPSSGGSDSPANLKWLPLDVTRREETHRVVAEVQPTIVFHFAGQARIQLAWDDPIETFRVNAEGTLNLLDSLRRTRPEARFVYAGSGTEYGTPDIVPTPEEAPLRPSNPYAASKAAADLYCDQFYRQHGLPVLRLRLFGTTGVGKRKDFCNDIIEQIAQLEQVKDPVLRVGNLNKERDILDGRDAVEAILTVARRGAAGEAYNIGRGTTVNLRGLLDLMLKESASAFRVVEDGARLRPTDPPVQWAAIQKIQSLGWEPTISIERTVRDLMEYWRKEVQGGMAH